MLRIIWPGALPLDRLQRICYPSIDRLQEISFSNGQSTGSTMANIDEFSAILRHIRIDRFWKCTKRNRLLETDRLLATHLPRKHLNNINFLDVGASDGVTTLDTVTYFQNNYGLTLNAFVADQYLFLVRRQRGSIVEYITTGGLPVLVRIGPVGLLLGSTEGLAGILLRPEIVLTRWLVSTYLNLTTFRAKMRMTAKIPLVNPVVLKVPNIHLIEMNILEFRPEMQETIDVIRASNIITKQYFSEFQINQVINILYRYLRPGGFLLISHNLKCGNGEVESGSIWEKTEAKFMRIGDLSVKSAIKEIVDQFQFT